MAGYDSLGVANNFYNALNAANLRALGNLQSLKAENDWNPVPSFLNTINARLRLASAILAGREREDYYNQLQAGLNGKGRNNTPSQLGGTMLGIVGQGIGVDEGGYYNTPAGGSIYGIDTSGWGVPSGESVGVKDMQPPQQQPNKFNFNDADYIPTALNGYHLGDYPQTEEYGDPTDYQRQMAANAIGYNLGSLEPRQQTWFSKTPQNTSQDSFGKAFLAVENPTTAQSSNFISGDLAKQFGSLMQTARNNGGQFNQQDWNTLKSDWNTLKSFQNPVSDVAPTVGGINTGATGNQAFDEKMNLRRWLEWDAQLNGVTNPLVSLDRYKMFMQPMRQQAELDELRNAYYTLNDPNASDADVMNATALISFHKNDPYMQEDRDMKRTEFGWKGQDFANRQALHGLNMKGRQLSNDLAAFKLKAALANGINPADAGIQMDEDGFIIGGNPFGGFGGGTKSKGGKERFPTNARKDLLDSSSALGALNKEIAEAEQKLKNPDLSDEEKKKISEGLDGDKGSRKKFKELQKEYIKNLTPYLYTKKFGGNGIDGLADLYLMMKYNDKSGLDSMALSDSIARAARGVVTNGKLTVDDIQKEILDRANMREDIAQFDDVGDLAYEDYTYGMNGVDPDNAELNKLASPNERLGQIRRLRENGKDFAYNDAKYGMYNNNLKGYQDTYGYTPPEASLEGQGTLEILGHKEGDKFVAPKGAMPSINRVSTRDPMQRVRGGGWGQRLKKNDSAPVTDSGYGGGSGSFDAFGETEVQGNPFVDRMRALIGWFPFRANDGTNCMRAISTALDGTPYGIQENGKPLYNVDQAVAIARQLGQLRDPSTYTPRAGDIVVTNYSSTTGHVGMVTENGGIIQNGSSGDEVPLNVTTADGRRNGSVYESDIPVNQLHDDIACYISTSDYLYG